MKIIVFYLMALFFILTYSFGQSFSDIKPYIIKIDKKELLKSQLKFINKIAKGKNLKTSASAGSLSDDAKETKLLLVKALDKANLYPNHIKSQKKYSKLKPKITSLKRFLNSVIDNSNTIKVYSMKFSDSSYKSSKNEKYYNKIRNAYNSLLDKKKNIVNKLDEITKIEIELANADALVAADSEIQRILKEKEKDPKEEAIEARERKEYEEWIKSKKK